MATWKLMMRSATVRQKLKADPNDLVASRELYGLLIEDGIRTEKTVQEVIDSYEGQSGLFAANATADNIFLKDQLLFNVYLRALAMTPNDPADKVTAACQRRFTALSGEPLAASPLAAAETAAEPTAGLTREQLAHAAISTVNGERTKTTVTSAGATPLATPGGPSASGGGEGGAKYSGSAGATYAGSASAGAAAGGAAKTADPIKVIVSQEKDHIVWRVLKPILSALLWTFVVRAT
jgi:hypothetical protein